jgi:ATP-dependent RNA helicase SUPV3L1/SUV3
VADDLKSLDQPSRAVLRKHGARFGAYHIYVPLQLKPAPRALAAQLWALKHGGPELKGLDELQRLAASGRTSFPADKEVPRALYRTIGYRVCGERAVRVDILERLADLIRPALAWRPGSSTAKPAGAFDGTGFVVTQSMTSLTGSSGDDFSSILQALGYRMEMRPKPVEPDPTPAPASDHVPSGSATIEDLARDEPSARLADEAGLAVSADHVASGSAESAAEPQVSEAPALLEAPEALEAAELEPALPAEAMSESTAALADRPSDEAVTALPAQPTQAVESGPETQASPGGEVGGAGDGSEMAAATSESLPPAEEGAVSAPAAANEADLIAVWRPGGRSRTDQRPQRRSPRRHRQEVRAPQKAPDAELQVAAPAEVAATGERAEAAAPDSGSEADKGERHRRRRRGPPGEFRGGRDGPRSRESRDRDSERPGRWTSERSERSERHERPHFAKDHGESKDRRDYAPRREREKQPDPDSPFAKLAALKAQLEANAKERR